MLHPEVADEADVVEITHWSGLYARASIGDLKLVVGRTLSAVDPTIRVNDVAAEEGGGRC